MKTCNLGFAPELLPDVLAILGKHIGSFAGHEPADAQRLSDIILSSAAPSTDDRAWIEAVYRAYAHSEQDTVGWPSLQLLETQHIRMQSYGYVVIDLSVEDYGRGQVVDLFIDFGRDSIRLAADLLSDFGGLPGMCYDQGYLGEMARYHLAAARHYAAQALWTPEQPEPEPSDVDKFLCDLTTY